MSKVATRTSLVSRRILIAATAGLMALSLTQAAHAVIPQSINVQQATGNFSIGSSCAITNSGRSNCHTNFQIDSGLEFQTVCTSEVVYPVTGGQQGACSIDNGSAGQGHPGTVSDVRVDAQACNPLGDTGFTIDSQSGYGVTFWDPVLENWTVTKIHIVATNYTGSGTTDQWTLVQGNAATGTGSYFTATFNGHTLSMNINGTLQSTSDCQHGIGANVFSFQDWAGNGSIV